MIDEELSDCSPFCPKSASVLNASTKHNGTAAIQIASSETRMRLQLERRARERTRAEREAAARLAADRDCGGRGRLVGESGAALQRDTHIRHLFCLRGQ